MWQARPIFVSSTFKDMQAERDLLRTHVFPELEERLARRRHYLEWVDLRVGVTIASLADAETRELHVLKVCLGEVKRCRPFMIVLLGDRYGWVPPLERAQSAAREERYYGDLAGRSVTDLEIDFGILRDPEQASRSLFYFRDPLPYGAMGPEIAALYSDACANDEGAAERAQQLDELKHRIVTTLPMQVRSYAAEWDKDQGVIGLDEWARYVADDIWRVLDAEIPQAPPEQSWQQAERNALEDFAADRARDFVGREAILARLIEHASAPADRAGHWGICITGEAGAGKSALFAELTYRLMKAGVFVLAHAAAMSPHAPSVDAMLRRWIEELAAELADPSELPVDAPPSQVETVFASLLGRVAKDRRVAVLVDALDQFEATTRGRNVTWLPRLWPDNARLVATAIPGEASAALAARDGIAMLPLPPLDRDEAECIIGAICDRYHRVFEREVVDALMKKETPEGSASSPGFAWGNALWLTLAVEELNLLDADDFKRADHDYEGMPEEQRLRQLMLDITAELPLDVTGLYDVSFERAAELFGARMAAGFLGLITISRGGWREVDFEKMLPRLTGAPWDALAFAQLRRLFRGQMRRRGTPAQWDFNHAQMRKALAARLSTDGAVERVLHTVAAHHLLALQQDDPLRISETMVHLLGNGNLTRAAAYFAGQDLSEAEERAATTILAGSPQDTMLALLDADGLDDVAGGNLAQRYLHQLDRAIEDRASLPERHKFLSRIAAAIERILTAYPRSARLLRELAVCCNKLGDIAMSAGRREDAAEVYRASRDTIAQLATAEPANAIWQRDLMVAHERVGDALQAAGQHDAALTARYDALLIAERLTGEKPDDDSRLQALATCWLGIVDAQLAIGRIDKAESACARARELAATIAGRSPGDPLRQRLLSVAWERLGDIDVRLERWPQALDHHDRSLEIAEALAASDPRNPARQHDLAIAIGKQAEVLARAGSRHDSAAFHQRSLAILEALATDDPADARRQHDLAAAWLKLGDLLVGSGERAGALTAYRRGLALRARLLAADPDHAEWQRNLPANYVKVADILAEPAVRAEILVQRPAAAVWNFLTVAGNWRLWWGELADVRPRWAEGAALHWRHGPPSRLVVCEPQRTLHIAGPAIVTNVTLSEQDGATLVAIEDIPYNGAEFTDGGASRIPQMQEQLRRLASFF